MPFTRFHLALREILMLLIAVATCLASTVGVLPRDAYGNDERRSEFFEGLRQRRLFSLVEGECLRQLANEELSAENAREYSLELSRTFTEHARFTMGREQADLWERAIVVLNECLENYPGSPHQIRFRLQAAFVACSQGETLLWESKLRPENQRIRAKALETLSKTNAQLRSLEKELTTASGNSADENRSEAPSRYELRAFAENVSYRLGIALQNRAQLQSSEPDRLSDLMDAESLFRRLSGGLEAEEISWSSKLRLAENYRLRGDIMRAKSVIESLSKVELPKSATPRITAEHVRLSLAMELPTEAGQQLIEYRKSGQIMTGDLYFLTTQVLASLWKIALEQSQQSLADDLFSKIEAETKRAEQEIGGYWGYRCQIILENLRDLREFGPELASLVRQAESAYAEGDVERSVNAFRQAGMTAESIGRNKLAAKFAFTAASIELNAGNYRVASQRLREFGKAFPNDERAARAHYLLAYCLAREYGSEPTKENREAYERTLNNHRQQFAADPTFGDATWLLAQLQEQRLQFTEAIELYQDIPATHPRGRAAQLGIARLFEFILARLRELNRDPQAWEEKAVEELTAIVSRFGRGAGLIEAEIMLRLARINISKTVPDYHSADALLEWILRASEGQETTDEDDKVQTWNGLATSALQLRIVSLAGQGKVPEARSLVDRLAEQSSDLVLNVLDGLAGVAAGADNDMRAELGTLQLAAAQSLTRKAETLTEAQKHRLKLNLAQSNAAVGNTTEALKFFEELLSENSKDLQLKKTVAGLLMQCGTNGCLEKAIGHWQKLEKTAKPGSDDWMNSRYQTASCLYGMGKNEECLKLIGLTRLIYPELGGEAMRIQFESLQEIVEKGDGK